MSIALPTIDLSSFAVGQQGTIDLSTTGPDSNPSFTQKKPQVILYNESGSGLQVFFAKGIDQHFVPAGAWVQLQIEPGEKTIYFVVVYNLPNPPVTKLAAVYFAPGETPPPLLILGNSPIGIGGTVNTSSVSTLSNEGNAAGQLVIDIGDVTLAQLIRFFTDHFILKVDQSGVAHTVLQGQTSGNPLQIGQTGDTSEVVGNLQVDQTLGVTGTSAFTGNLSANAQLAVAGITSLDGGLTSTDGTGQIIIPNNLYYKAKDSGAIARGIMGTNPTNDTLARIAGATSFFIVQSQAGASVMNVNSSAFSILCKLINDISGNNLVDWSAGGVFLKGNPANHGRFNYQSDGTNTDWGMSAMSTGTGTSVVGSQTVTHNLKVAGVAATPDIVLFNDTSGGSMTGGASAIGATTFSFTAGQAHTYRWWAIKF